jgi:bifunctional non-homologous end joining protein LigD
MPSSFIKPCEPIVSRKVPTGAAWIYEIKHDGFRFMLRKMAGDIRARSRTGKDWTDAVPGIVEAVRTLPAESVLIDGECVVCDDRGITDFAALRTAMAKGMAPHAVLYAFDLLELDGEDLRSLPWEDRRSRLVVLTKAAMPAIVLSEHADGDGEALFRKACEMGLEGLVAKRRQSRYRSGPSKDWIKIKNPQAPAYRRVQNAIAAKRDRR